MHYGFSLLGILPQSTGKVAKEGNRFAIDYTFFLKIAFLVATGVLAWLNFGGKKQKHQHHGGGGKGKQSIIERALFWLAIASYIWLAGGIIASFFT